MNAPDPTALATEAPPSRELTTPAEGPITDAERVQLLARRLERERQARRASEQIAEAGLRRLWQAKDEVDQRVEERTAQLRRAQQAATSAADAKTEFLANLSHEVRTPLQTVMAALELARPTDGADRERHQEAIDAVASLRALFDDLLELAECEVGSVDLHPAPTDLCELADRAVQRWQATFTTRGMLVVPDASGVATLDADRLDQIADALLANAAKFADPGTVGLRLVATDDGWVEMVVDDAGPGVDEDQRDRIFEPFVQVHGGNDRAVGGAGIGLALVRGLARQMGGDAHAQRSEPGGLAVVVRIPGGDRS